MCVSELKRWLVVPFAVVAFSLAFAGCMTSKSSMAKDTMASSSTMTDDSKNMKDKDKTMNNGSMQDSSGTKSDNTMSN